MICICLRSACRASGRSARGWRRRSRASCCSSWSSAPALAFVLVPRPLVALFTHDPQVIALGMVLLRIAGVFQLFDGVQAVAGGALRGAGDVRFSFYANLTAYWVIGLPLALVLGFTLGWGAPGIWWGLTLGLILVAVA